jgi:hypothetical protein
VASLASSAEGDDAFAGGTDGFLGPWRISPRKQSAAWFKKPFSGAFLE